MELEPPTVGLFGHLTDDGQQPQEPFWPFP